MYCRSHLRAGSYVFDDSLRVGKVNKVKQDARMLGYLVQQPVSSTVHVRAAQHMIAGCQQVNH